MGSKQSHCSGWIINHPSVFDKGMRSITVLKNSWGLEKILNGYFYSFCQSMRKIFESALTFSIRRGTLTAMRTRPNARTFSGMSAEEWRFGEKVRTQVKSFDRRRKTRPLRKSGGSEKKFEPKSKVLTGDEKLAPRGVVGPTGFEPVTYRL